MPKISFVMPTRNRLEWIGESIQSVLTQTETDIELIIVNDASDDGTKEFLDDWASKFPNVKIIHNETRQGGGRSRNIGMQAASSPIIAVCDDDDLNANERASLALKHFEINPDSDLVNYPYISIGYCNERIKEYDGDNFDEELFKKNGQVNYFCNPSVSFRKNVIEELGGYEPETDKETDDYQFVRKLVNAGKRIDFDPRYYVNFHRVLPDSMMAHSRGWKPEWAVKK